MTDVRATPSRDTTAPVFKSFVYDNSTVLYDSTKERGSSQVDLAVGVLAGGIIELVSDGEAVLGRLDSVESDGVCRVQTGGTTYLPGGSAATLTEGTTFIGALGAASAKGYIRSAASGTAAELIKARGMIVDNTTATAVEVDLSA